MYLLYAITIVVLVCVALLTIILATFAPKKGVKSLSTNKKLEKERQHARINEDNMNIFNHMKYSLQNSQENNKNPKTPEE